VKTAFKIAGPQQKWKDSSVLCTTFYHEVRMQILMHFVCCKGRPSGDSRNDVSHYLPIGFLQSQTLWSSGVPKTKVK